MSERSPVLPRTCRRNAAPNKSVSTPYACLPLSGLQFLPFSAARAVCISPQYFHPLAFPFAVLLRKAAPLRACSTAGKPLLFVSLYRNLYNLSVWPCVLHSPAFDPIVRLFMPWQGVHASVYADRFCLLSSGSNMSETDKKSRCQFPVLTSSHVGIELSSSVFQQTQTRV